MVPFGFYLHIIEHLDFYLCSISIGGGACSGGNGCSSDPDSTERYALPVAVYGMDVSSLFMLGANIINSCALLHCGVSFKNRRIYFVSSFYLLSGLCLLALL